MKPILIPLFILCAGTASASSHGAGPGRPGAHFIENWDLDGDGRVTLAEATEKRGQLFYMFDQDENGVLDAGEYDLFDGTREADMDTNAGGHKKGPMKQINAGMMREYNDADGDGTVSQAEFHDKSGDWFALVDRDGDGSITPADFARRGN